MGALDMDPTWQDNARQRASGKLYNGSPPGANVGVMPGASRAAAQPLPNPTRPTAEAPTVEYDQMGNVISGGANAHVDPTTPKVPDRSGVGGGRSAGPGGVLVRPSAPTTAPASVDPTVPAAPAAAENPTGSFTPIKTTNPESPYDADIRFTHDVARMLAMGGDAEGHQQYLQQWDQLSSKRVQHIADEAIRGLATGNLQKAIEIHNHVVPNGRQIVGYKPVEGGYEFQYNDGKTEKGSNAQIAGMLTQYKDPSYLIQIGLKTAAAKNDMAKEASKQSLIGQRELTVQQFKDQNAVAMKQLEKQLDMNTVAGISRGTAPGDTSVYVRMKSGGMYKLETQPGLPVNGKPGPETQKLVPINPQQAPQAGVPSGTQGVAGGGGVTNWSWGAGG